MQACSFASPTPESTAALARTLGRSLAEANAAELPSEAIVIVLSGPLGAGKTVFAQGLADGLGLDPAQVSSPTFTLAAEHRSGAQRLVHVDCYRLADADELEAMGVADWLAPGSVVAVEWGDRFPASFPEDRLEVALARTGEVGHATAAGSTSASTSLAEETGLVQARRVEVRARGPLAVQRLRRWFAAWVAAGAGQGA